MLVNLPLGPLKIQDLQVYLSDSADASDSLGGLDFSHGLKRVHTVFGGRSTINLPSLSRIVFSLRSRQLSKMYCTTLRALGSWLRKGIVTNDRKNE